MQDSGGSGGAVEGRFSSSELRWVVGGLLVSSVVIAVSGYVSGFGGTEEELAPPHASPTRFAGGQTWSALTAAYLEQVDGKILRFRADGSSASATTFFEGEVLQWTWRDGVWVTTSREPADEGVAEVDSRALLPSEYSLDQGIQKTSASTNVDSDAEVEVVMSDSTPLMLTLDDGSTRGSVTFEDMP